MIPLCEGSASTQPIRRRRLGQDLKCILTLTYRFLNARSRFEFFAEILTDETAMSEPCQAPSKSRDGFPAFGVSSVYLAYKQRKGQIL